MNETLRNEIADTYDVEAWGAGYFEIGPQGNLLVRPARGDARYASLKEIVDHLITARQLKSPLLLRFPQLLENQLRRLHEAYERATQEFRYTGRHFPVFPLKVNPRREVVETFLKTGTKIPCGLECGSKAELCAALALDRPADSLLVCNGFKDVEFIKLALLAVQSGQRVVIVVEKLNELEIVIREARESGVTPLIGLRAKLYSRGSGKWAESGGESAKFGLTTSEILECIRRVKAAGLSDALKLLHFHIGSQITDIKRIKNAMREAARVYCKVRQLGVNVEFLDIGGGMGVDYDGSKTMFEASINYSMQEFANNAVYVIRSVCDDEAVPHPNLVTESGRVMTAYHSVLILSIRDEIETFADDQPQVTVDADDPQAITELKEMFDGINSKNYREFYHDALEQKDALYTQFDLGLVSLEDRAKGEVLFWETCARAYKLSRAVKSPEEEFETLRKILASKYLCNFSVFRSAPDSWAIGQLFPIMPIHRLHELPTELATLVDLTCDSDGKIDRFVDIKDVKDVLELHHFRQEPYYLAMFLVGAYQEVMGSNHNLFGQPNEAQVVIDADGRFHVTKIVPGNTVGDMLNFAKYDTAQLRERFERRIASQVESGQLTREAGDRIVAEYAAAAAQQTYLG
ncbi:MAG: biosynthetic arginine decarboxylase [Planctomycetes bacterium]|nr:biosynthetic arginine decarboxylase [Planctomycetota bacterium]